MTAWLRLRSLLTEVDWYIALCEAYERQRWADFLYCLRRPPALWKRDVLSTHATPFILCVESGDPKVVRAALEQGADVEVLCERVEDLESEYRRYLAPGGPSSSR